MSAAPTQSAQPAARPRHNPWAIALTVSLAAFMEVLDTNIANVALPYIAGGLSSSVDEATWVLTSYLVSNAIVLPITGWLSTVIGRKRFYILCVILFSLSSFLCGIAPSLGLLIVFRILQGLGGGGLQPVSQAILADTFPPDQFGMAFAVYGMAVVVGPAVGPVLGGYLTDHYSWRWIFFINLPVGVVAIILCNRLVEDPPYLRELMRKVRANFRIDYAGLILLTVGLGCLQVMLDKGQEDDWFNSGFITALAVICAIAIIFFIIWELIAPSPVMDLRMLRNRNFGMACAMMFTLGIVIYTVSVLIPSFLQAFMGYTAYLAGLALSPGALVVILLLPVVGRLGTILDGRVLIATGFLITSLAMIHITGIDARIDFKTAITYRIFQAFGTSFLFIPINTMAYVGVAREKGGQVSGTVNLFRNIGGSVGISMFETLVARRSQYNQHYLVWNTNGYMQPFDASVNALRQHMFLRGMDPTHALRQSYALIYQNVITQASVLAYIDAAWIVAVLCMIMVPATFLLRRSRPGEAPRTLE